MSHFPPAGRTSCLSACSQDQSRAGPLHWGLRMNGYAVCIYGCHGEQKAIFGIQRETSRRVLLAWHRCIMSYARCCPWWQIFVRSLKDFWAASSPGELSMTPNIILAEMELEA